MDAVKTTDSMQRVLSKLAYFTYSINSDTKVDLKVDIHRHLVLQAFASSSSDWLSADEIIEILDKLFNLSFEPVEIYDALNNLRKHKRIEIETRTTEGKNVKIYRIDPYDKIKINDAAEVKKDLRLRVEQEWINQIENNILRKVTAEERDCLLEDIEIYLGLLAAERGAHSILSAFGSGQDIIESILQLEQKPKWKKRDGEYKKLRNDAIQLFLREPTENRRKYIVELSESAFFLSLLHIDPDLSDLAKSAFKNKKIFLDSNIIYRLLGLQTEALQGMTQRVVEASKELGCSLKVSTLSIRELRVSLDRAVAYLKRNPPLTRDYERLKIQYTGEGRGFIIAYWKEYEQNGTPLEHFANKYRNIEKILTEQYGIEITDEYVEVVLQETSTASEVQQFSKFLAGYAQQKTFSDYVVMPNYVPRHEELINHDARLLRVVEKVRKIECDKCSSFSEATAWLLTADAQLINYSHMKNLRAKSGMPIAIHAREWLLFLRPWLPRTKDYDRTFVELVSSEHIQSFSLLSPILIDQVLRVLTSYKGFTPELAAEMLADFGFTNQLRAIEWKVQNEIDELYEDEKGVSEEEKKSTRDEIRLEKTREVLELKIVDMINQKEREKANALFQKSVLEKALIQEENAKTKLEAKIAAQSDELNGLNKKIEKTSENVGVLVGQVGGLETQNKVLEKSLNLMRWALGMMVGILIIFWIAPMTKLWIGYGLNEDAAKIIQFVVYGVGITLPFGIGLGIKRTWKIITTIDVLIGVFGFFWKLFD